MACPCFSPPQLINIDEGTDSTGDKTGMVPVPIPAEEIEGKHNKGKANDFFVPVAFAAKGARLYCGSPRGKIFVVDTASQEVIESFSVTSSSTAVAPIKSIEFSRDGGKFLVNAFDR